MTKIEAIINLKKFEAVQEALIAAGVEGMTVSEVRGHGRQKGHTESYHGREYDVNLLPKVKIDLVVSDEVVDVIADTAATGKIGDGKIFVYKIDDAIRIRNKEHGEGAL